MGDSPTARKTFVVPDIKPLDLYDCSKAKICASIGWLLAKSYGSAATGFNLKSHCYWLCFNPPPPDVLHGMAEFYRQSLFPPTACIVSL
ncbi:unnamed protein product [Knipowitschia caucasica]